MAQRKNRVPTPRQPRYRGSWIRYGVLCSSLLIVSGWVLSACGQLNRTGYLLALGLITAILFGWARVFGHPARPARPFWNWKRLRWRFKHCLPLCYLLVVALSLVGGLLNPPYNVDTSLYRLPRMLHWIGAERWHWIHTGEVRMNGIGNGMEWLQMPWLLLLRSDHWLFLPNWLIYLALPGLMFAFWRRVGVSGRVAWTWAWVLSAAHCFAFQAGSTVNDAAIAGFGLAACVLAREAVRHQRMEDLWLSMLAIAVMTAIKQSAVLLVLPWLVAAWPAWRLALARPLATLGVGVLAFWSSAGPLVWVDLQRLGCWTGLPPGHLGYTALPSPFWGVLGNVFSLLVQNLRPPVMPGLERWNALMEHFLTTSWGAPFRCFERFGYLHPGFGENSAGLGCFVTALFLLSCAALVHKAWSKPGTFGHLAARPLLWVPWVALVLFMAKVGAFESARLLTPYYPFVFALVLACPGQGDLLRKRWWQAGAGLAAATTVALLLISYQRPVLPVPSAAALLSKLGAPSEKLRQVARPYTWPSYYTHVLTPLLGQLPPDTKVIGYTQAYQHDIDLLYEAQLWLPLGTRRVELVLSTDTPEQVRQKGIQFMVIDNFGPIPPSELEAWLRAFNATIVAVQNVEQRHGPPSQARLVKLNQQ